MQMLCYKRLRWGWGGAGPEGHTQNTNQGYMWIAGIREDFLFLSVLLCSRIFFSEYTLH